MLTAEKLSVMQAFVLSSHYYGRPISDEVAQLYQMDVDDLPAAEVIRALQVLRREPKRRTCPLPAEVRAKAEVQDGAHSAEQVAARMAGAIARFGYTRPKEARAYIGEAGWAAAEEMGGWASICQRVTTAEIGTFTAQARELCRAHLDRPPVTHQDVVALPEQTQRRLQVLAGGIG